MNKTPTFEQISHFSNVEIDQFIADFLANGNHQTAPDFAVINNIMNFSKAYSNPFNDDFFMGIINN